MDRATIKPEIPESLKTDYIIHNSAGTDLTILALYYSGTSGGNFTELKLQSPVTNSVKNEDKMGDDFIYPSSGMISDLVVIAPQVENYHKHKVSINERPNAPDLEEETKQDISAVKQEVKQEIMDVVIKKEETGDVSMEQIHNKQTIEEEIQDCKENIKLEDDMTCSWVDNINETVKTEGQPVVLKNELSEEKLQEELGISERINGESGDDEKRISKRVRKTRIPPGAVTVASLNEGSDEGSESQFLSSRNGSDHKDDNLCLNPKRQLHRNKKQKKILRSKDAEEYVPRKGDSWHGNTNKSSKKFWRDTNKICHSDARPHDEVKPFSCADCGKSFSRLGNLKTHQLLHTGKKLFICEICNKTFAQPAGLHSHIKIHQDSERFSCADCGKSFSYLSNLKKHQLVHSGKKLFLCTDCGKSFSQLSNLKTHQLLHTGKKIFTCEACDKSFAQPSGLRYHMITHQAVKPFLCTDCKKSFSRLNSLKLHQLLHTGMKPFACEICDKSFAQPNGLRHHMKTHQAVKPFSCTDCGKSFSQLCSLKKHQLLHSGKTLYACDTFDKTFAHPAGTQSHMKIHEK